MKILTPSNQIVTVTSRQITAAIRRYARKHGWFQSAIRRDQVLRHLAIREYVLEVL